MKYQRNPMVSNELKKIHKDFHNQIFMVGEEENEVFNSRRLSEKAVMYYLSSGDIAKISELLSLQNVQSMEVGNLSDSPVEQSFGLFIAAVTMYTRAAIDGGLPEHIAYSLSDSYIRQVYKITSPEKIDILTYEALYDFTNEVYNYKYRSCSKPTKGCCEYINRHLHEKISLEDLSKITGKSPNYVSDLFAKELGQRPQAFIRQQKLIYARHLFDISDLSVNAVSYLLAFPSASSFITAFSQEYGITPHKYKTKEFSFITTCPPSVSRLRK